MFVLFLLVLYSGENKLNAEAVPVPCPMGYAIFEHNIFGGGRYLVLRCDCEYEKCKGWDQQCQEGTIFI